MNNLPTLYALASSGKIKQWRTWTEGDQLYSEAGYVDGKKKTNPRTIKGKNIGRSNETAPAEQAEKEALSKWKKQKDKGYVEDIDNIPSEDEVERFLPMLAHSVEKKKHKIIYPGFVQPKLDGIRCLARVDADGNVILWSRKGKVFTVLEEEAKCKNTLHAHIKDLLLGGGVLDGELFIPDFSFQKITAATKKMRPDTCLLQYHVYDMPVPGLSFSDRWGALQEKFRVYLANATGARVLLVRTVPVTKWEHVQAWEQAWIQRGYEGLMFRNSNGDYKFGHRSHDLLKVKQFMEEEYEIVGGKSAGGLDEGTVVFLCKTAEHKQFEVRPMGSREYRARLFRELEDLKGKMLTVKFQELTDDGIPRFPVGKAIRDYE